MSKKLVAQKQYWKLDTCIIGEHLLAIFFEGPNDFSTAFLKKVRRSYENLKNTKENLFENSRTKEEEFAKISNVTPILQQPMTENSRKNVTKLAEDSKLLEHIGCIINTHTDF